MSEPHDENRAAIEAAGDPKHGGAERPNKTLAERGRVKGSGQDKAELRAGLGGSGQGRTKSWAEQGRAGQGWAGRCGAGRGRGRAGC